VSGLRRRVPIDRPRRDRSRGRHRHASPPHRRRRGWADVKDAHGEVDGEQIDRACLLVQTAGTMDRRQLGALEIGGAVRDADASVDDRIANPGALVQVFVPFDEPLEPGETRTPTLQYPGASELELELTAPSALGDAYVTLDVQRFG